MRGTAEPTPTPPREWRRRAARDVALRARLDSTGLDSARVRNDAGWIQNSDEAATNYPIDDEHSLVVVD